ncbi:uncharacterized protein [Ptychodera flava]|uniref:uncharacterized protein n=1 Tax=Ptychodera flava TaxID=63121 RepID=UPI003969F392
MPGFSISDVSYQPKMPPISQAIFDEVYYADTPDCRRNKQTTSLTTSPLMSVLPSDTVTSQIKPTVGRAKYTTYLENVTQELSVWNVTNENFTSERAQHITFWEDASKTSSGDDVTSESLTSDSGNNKSFPRGTDEVTSEYITEYEINASGSEVKVSEAEPLLYVDWNSTAQNDEKLYEKTTINKLEEDDTVNIEESTLREQNGGVSNKITMSENAANDILTRTRENTANTLTNKETSTKLNTGTRNTVNVYDSMIPMGMFFSRGVDECE